MRWENLKVWLYVNEADAMDLLQIIQVCAFASDCDLQNDVIPLLGPKNRGKIIKDIKFNISNFMKQYKKELAVIAAFYKLKGLYSTDFNLDRSSFQITIPNELHYGAEDIFNKVIMTEQVPFCYVVGDAAALDAAAVQDGTAQNTLMFDQHKGFYKIFKDIKPPEEWLNASQDIGKLQSLMLNTIRMVQIFGDDAAGGQEIGDASSLASGIAQVQGVGRVVGHQRSDSIEESDGLVMMKLLSVLGDYKESKMLDQYTDVEILVRRDSIIITMQTVTNRGIGQEETIERIRQAIGQNLFMFLDAAGGQGGEEGGLANIENVSIAGTFFYPGMILNLEIFSDMVMNNEVFNKYLKIDENLKLQKKKNQVYCYFLDKAHPGINDSNQVTANITNQVVDKRDPVVRLQIDKRDQEKFPTGSNYLRIRVTKTNNVESLVRFKIAMDKLMQLYQKEKRWSY